MTPPTPAFAYLRVSGRSQLDGDGFPRQQECIAMWAAAHDTTVVTTFQERAVSGTLELEDREALTELLAALRESAVRLVLVERADRLARDVIVAGVILREFERLGVRVVECDGGQELTIEDGNPTRKLIRTVLSAVAEFEKTVTVAKLRAARNRIKQRTGRCEGGKPYGMLEGEAVILARITAWRCEGIDATLMCEWLDAAHIQPRHGTRWNPAVMRRIVQREGRA